MKILLITLLLTSSAFAQKRGNQYRSSRSGGMGNGGHPYEIEFKNSGKQVLSILNDEDIEGTEDLKAINLYLLGLNLETVTVEIKKKVLKDKFGRIKGALNFPQRNLIQINESNWAKIRNKVGLKLPFVLHELLGLSGEEVDHYRISSQLPRAIKQFSKSLMRPIDLDSAEGQQFVTKYDSLRKVSLISHNNLKYYYGFENSFGLRKHQYDVLDLVCQDLGFSYHVDARVSISNYLVRSIISQNGSVTLSDSKNVDKKIETVYCGK